MYPVFLNVYDVTNGTSESSGSAIVRFNSVAKELGVGGIFHGAVEIEGYEWSFGYCEQGSGVYCCAAKKNPMYNYRETISLGTTPLTMMQIREIIARLKAFWPGASYELLTRNCNNFCVEFCDELKCDAPPGWLNRLASGAGATVQMTNDAISMAKQIGNSIATNPGVTWMRDSIARLMSAPEPTSGAIPKGPDERIPSATPEDSFTGASAQQSSSTSDSDSADKGDFFKALTSLPSRWFLPPEPAAAGRSQQSSSTFSEASTSRGATAAEQKDGFSRQRRLEVEMGTVEKDCGDFISFDDVSCSFHASPSKGTLGSTQDLLDMSEPMPPLLRSNEGLPESIPDASTSSVGGMDVPDMLLEHDMLLDPLQEADSDESSQASPSSTPLTPERYAPASVTLDLI